jgi:hypothetical protein
MERAGVAGLSSAEIVDVVSQPALARAERGLAGRPLKPCSRTGFASRSKGHKDLQEHAENDTPCTETLTARSG